MSKHNTRTMFNNKKRREQRKVEAVARNEAYQRLTLEQRMARNPKKGLDA